MARGINKVIVLGNLGADPDARYMPNGNAVTNIRIATTRAWKNKESGDSNEETEWHRVVFFGRLAEIASEYLKKGSQVYLQTRKWEDKEGNDRWTTEIVANEMQMLGERISSSSNSDNFSTPKRSGSEFASDDFDDDIPF